MKIRKKQFKITTIDENDELLLIIVKKVCKNALSETLSISFEWAETFCIVRGVHAPPFITKIFQTPNFN